MNALEGRIRMLAREEAAAVLDGAPASSAAAGPDRVTELEKEVADLRGRLERLEKAASGTTARRTSRKAESSESSE